MSLDELARIANMMPELIYIIKFFGTIIASLLSIMAIMSGVILNNIRNEIKANKDDSVAALKEHKDDEKLKCSGCSMANLREHEEIWDAIETCCPRGK